MKKLLYLLFIIQFQLVAQTEAILLNTWNNDDITGKSEHKIDYNEVWGVSVNEREYAILGSFYGLHFIDITKTDSIYEVQRLKGSFSNPKAIHRDFKHYRNYLYTVVDEENIGSDRAELQIIDLNYLPDSISVVYQSNEFLTRSHNVYIDTSAAVAYFFLARKLDYSPFASVLLLDISDPIHPKYLNEISSNVENGTQPIESHDGYVKNGILYWNAGNDGLSIYDCTDPLNLKRISWLADYPEKGYCHSGWLDDNEQYYYMADETHGKDLKVVDVTDKNNPRIVSLFAALDEDNPFSIPHNVFSKCNYVFSSYYFDGYQVFDMTDPLQPKLDQYYDTYDPPSHDGFAGAWGIYPNLPSGNILLSDVSKGLFIFAGPKDGWNINCKRSVGTQEINQINHFEIYPNPTSGTFFWKMIDNQHIESIIKLVDCSGKNIYIETTFESFGTINLEKYPNGVYWLSVTNKDGHTTKPIYIHK